MTQQRMALALTLVLSTSLSALAGNPFGGFSNQLRGAANRFSGGTGGGQNFNRAGNSQWNRFSGGQQIRSNQSPIRQFQNNTRLQSHIQQQWKRHVGGVHNPIPSTINRHRNQVIPNNIGKHLGDHIKAEVIRRVVPELVHPHPKPGKPQIVIRPPVGRPIVIARPHHHPAPICTTPICTTPVYIEPICSHPIELPPVVGPVGESVPPAPLEAVTEEGDTPVLFANETVALPVDDLTTDAGLVEIKVGPVRFEAEVYTWGPDKIVFGVPQVNIEEPAAALLVLLTEQGEMLAEVVIEIAPERERPVYEQVSHTEESPSDEQSLLDTLLDELKTAPAELDETPAPPAGPLTVPVGSRVTLNGKDFGETPGQVRVQVGALRLKATVVSWTATSAEVELPNLKLGGPTPAELVIMDGNGQVAERATIELVSAS